MKTHLVSARLTTMLMMAAAVLLACAIGAWESISPSPTTAAEQRSAFVQSGGVTTDLDASEPGASQALGHARAPHAREVAGTTF